MSEYDNFALACPACNGYKSDFVTGVYPEADTEVRLYHPRREFWSDHFGVNDANEIQGTTDVGRATVARLQLNHVRQLTARAFWRSNGIFP